MHKPATKWWYALVAASPNPEEEEAVNVGVIVGNGRPEYVDFIPGLPRLSGLVPPSESAVYQAILESIAVQLSEEGDLDVIRYSIAPQLRIAQPRGLYAEPTRETLLALRHRFLQSPAREGRSAERAYRPRASARLDRLMEPVLPALGVSLLRRARIESLYPELPRDLLRTELHPVSRVLRSPGRDVLLDSVVVTPVEPVVRLEARAMEVGKKFWHLAQLKHAIRQYSGREVRTMGVVLNGDTHADARLRDAKAYIEHVWRKDADVVLAVDTEEEVREFQEQISWVSPKNRES
jgi:hypothetical protein